VFEGHDLSCQPSQKGLKKSLTKSELLRDLHCFFDKNLLLSDTFDLMSQTQNPSSKLYIHCLLE